MEVSANEVMVDGFIFGKSHNQDPEKGVIRACDSKDLNLLTYLGTINSKG